MTDKYTKSDTIQESITKGKEQNVEMFKDSERYVAIHFLPLVIDVGQSRIFVSNPAVNCKGPYRVGIHSSSPIKVRKLQFANVTPLVGWTPRSSWDQMTIDEELFSFDFGNNKAPQFLVPIDGPRLYVQNTVMLECVNEGIAASAVNIVVWGTPDLQDLE